MAVVVDGQMPAVSVAVLLPKPTGAQSQIQLSKLSVWYAARLAGSGSALHFYSGARHSDGSFRPGVFNDPPGAESVFFEQLLAPTELSYYEIGLKCGPELISAATEPCRPAVGAPVEIRGMEVTLSEDSPPIVSPPGGTLFAGGPQSGTRTVTYAATDLQSGLAKVDAMLDGTVVTSQDLSTRCFYADFTVCPTSDDGTLQIDTTTVPNGPHSLRLRVTDAAGNERLVNGGSIIDVANAAALESAATPLPLYSLTARFEGSSRSTLSAPYGRRVSLRGRMTRDSAPVPVGTEIDVLERIDRGGTREVVTGHVRTTADGSFSYVLPTKRPSRTLRLAYHPIGGAPALSAPLRLRIRAACSLRASLRGVVVHFRGRVRSGPIPKSGKKVQMEGRAPGSGWTSFATLRTNRRGSFSGRYRLRIHRPGVVLKIRAIMPPEDSYGYLRGRSKSITLRVR